MDIGSALTIASAWISLGLWSGAISLLWSGRIGRGRSAYTIGLVVFLIHVACAMQFYHGWSQPDAYEFTADQSEALTGIRAGWGLVFNYLFAVVWLIDLHRWRQMGDAAYAAERSFARVATRAFAFFMVVNGAIVFVGGSRRWLGIALLLPLTLSAAGCWRARPRGPTGG